MLQPGSTKDIRHLQTSFMPDILRRQQRGPYAITHSFDLIRDFRQATGLGIDYSWLLSNRLLIGMRITPDPPLHLWIDPRFERHICNERGHYEWRLCASLHPNFTHEPQGILPVAKQDGPLVYICHEIGTDSRTREIFLLDHAILSLPCHLNWDTPIQTLVDLPPPTKALRGRRYYQPQPDTVAVRGRGRSSILAKTYPVKLWSFSRERCG